MGAPPYNPSRNDDKRYRDKSSCNNMFHMVGAAKKTVTFSSCTSFKTCFGSNWRMTTWPAPICTLGKNAQCSSAQ